MKTSRIITISMILITLFIMCTTYTNAATLTINSSKSEAISGDTITITINGNGITGKVGLSAIGGTLDKSNVWVENSTVTATVKVSGSGDVKVTATPIDVSDSNSGEAVSVGSTSTTIKVNKKAPEDSDSNEQNKANTTTTTTNTINSNSSSNNNTTTAPATNTATTNSSTTENKPVETKKSSNANISSLWITPREYDFTGSKASVLVYNTKVPFEVEEIIVGGSTQDSKAKFTAGIGKKKLQVGNNSVKVEVTAEDGNKKTYTINITREEKKAEEENKTENTISQQENTIEDEKKVEENDEKQFKDSDLVKLEVKGYNISPEYSPDVYEYRMNVDDKVERLDVIAQKKDSNVDIEIAGNTELKDGENVITILVNNKKTNKNATYQIIVNKLSEVDLNSVNQALDDKIKESENNKKIVIGAIIGVNALIIIFILIKNIFSSDDEEYDIEENEEEDADDNDGKGEKVENLNLKENENKIIGLNKNMNENYEEISNTKHRKKGKHF